MAIYVVQVQFDDEFMFFTREEDARSKVDELRQESLEQYPELYAEENDLEQRFCYEAVEEGQLWWP